MLGLSLFFGLFLFMGLLFTFFLVREGLTTLNTYRWVDTPCRILESGVEIRDSNETPYRFIVQYNYEYKGERYVDSTYRRSYDGGGDYTKAFRLTRAYPAGGEAVCFVNPGNPQEAVLKREPPWMLLFIFLPLVFVAIGGGGLYAVWSKRWKSKSITSRASKKDPVRKEKKAKLLLGVFLLFMLLGGGFFWGLCLTPLKKIVTAGSRLEVPCTVRSSQVRSHEGDDSTTYSVDILYRYEVEGETYLSNRYGFIGGSSSGYHGKAAIVKQHAPGTRTVCYVAPEDPADAVLRKDFHPIYLLLLIPPVFFLIGLAGVYGQMKQLRAAPGQDRFLPADARHDEGFSVSESGPVTLKPSASPLMKWVGSIIFCLFWNGIVSVFVVQAWQAWKAGHTDWFLTIFLIPFVLVGLGSLLLVLYFFLALFNPRPRVTLGSVSLRLGDSTSLEWSVKGRRGGIRAFTIKLEGREEATYRRGTDTRTDKNVFVSLPVVVFDHGLPTGSGSAELNIPGGAMHSFTATHNKIVWYLKVHGEIARWPDIEDEYLLAIQPLPLERIQA